MQYFSLLALVFVPLAVLCQGNIPAGEVRAIEQAFVDGERAGAAANSYGGYGGYGNGYGYNNYGYGGYNPYGGYYSSYYYGK